MFTQIKAFYLDFYTRLNNVRIALMGMAVLLFNQAVAAQTAVPVQIEVPVSDMMSYLNQWIGILAPVVLFLGMIPVAMGLLRYLTKLFQSAFQGGS